MQQHISNFKISMHRINLVKSSEAIKNLFQEISSLILSQSLFLIKIAFQITSIAILHSNKLCSLGTPCINISNHILIVAFF